MRNQILTLIFLFAALGLSAQVKEGKAAMSQGSQSALYVKLENVQAKDVESEWIKYARNFNGKTSKVKKTDEYMTDDATIKDMSENTVDIYALAKQEGPDVQFFLWFDLGGAYLDARLHSGKIGEGRKILEDFARTVRVDQMEALIKEQEGVVKKMEKELADFEKDQKDAEKAIADLEKKIEESVKNQEAKRAEIKTGQVKLDELQQALKKVEKN